MSDMSSKVMMSLQVLPRISDSAAVNWDQLPVNEGVIFKDQMVYRVVDAVIEYLKSTGLEYQVGAFETTLIGNLPELLKCIEHAHIICHGVGCDRVMSIVKIDTGTRELSFEEKLHQYQT